MGKPHQCPGVGPWLAYLTTALASFWLPSWLRGHVSILWALWYFPCLWRSTWRAVDVGWAAGLIACVASAPWRRPGRGRWPALPLAAGAGWPLGLGLTRRWAYGRMVSILTVWAFALVLMSIVGAWDDWNAQAVFAHDTLTAELDKRTEANPADEQAAAIRANLTWLKDRCASLGLGLTFCPVLIGACVAVVIHGPLGPAEVRTARASWLLQGHACPGMASVGRHFGRRYVVYDRRWPVTGLRIVSWNTAVGLSAVYWLNGLSILVYAATVLRPHLFVTVGRSVSCCFTWAFIRCCVLLDCLILGATSA